MMQSLFIQILNMSLTGALMILAVLLLRLLLKRAPRIFSYGLWAVVLFRLLCPISFESGFSLLGVLHAPTAETGVVNYISDDAENMETVQTTLTQMNPDEILIDLKDGQNTVMPEKETGIGEDALTGVTLNAFFPAMGMVWLAGVIAMLLYGAVSYGRLSFRLRKAEVSTPFVMGFLKPRIYLPDNLSEQDLEYILLHERIHIRRGDHLTRVAAYLALCLHWFNPLVWLAFFISGQDMEMSCDEAVIRKIGNGVKKQYSATLLSLASGRRITVGIPLAFGEGDPKSRIKNVLRYKKPAFLLLLAALLVCVLAAVFLLGNPQKMVQHQFFYGVVMESEEFGGNVVLVPQFGEMSIPEAEKVSPYIEMDFDGLEPGHMVRITFSGEEEIGILETYPGQFSRAADSIEVMGTGFVMQTMPDGKYRFGVPLGMAEEAKAGDTLRIYHSVLEDGADLQENYHLYLLDSPDKIREELVAETFVAEVDSENYDIWVELSREEVNTFLSEFGFGVFCELEVAAEETEEPGSIWEEEPWKKERSWQDAVPVAELSPEEIAFDYRSFHFLSGMSVDEVEEATKRELEFLEYWGDRMIYKDSGDMKYYFLTDQDAFYRMEYDTPDADDALSLAQSCYEEIYALYGENENAYVYSGQFKIHKIESVEELENNKFIDGYGESWAVLYSGRMEEKIKDYLSTEKVQLSLDLLTPIHRQQGFYTVGISQISVSLEALKNEK